MKIYNLKRGQGKTTRLIYISEYTGYPILTFTHAEATRILECASHLGVVIPKPIPIDSYKEMTKGKRINGLLIDEVELVLGSLLQVPIKTITVNSEDVMYEKN